MDTKRHSTAKSGGEKNTPLFIYLRFLQTFRTGSITKYMAFSFNLSEIFLTAFQLQVFVLFSSVLDCISSL